MSVTAKEIARELNISAAAVSMALNNKPGVSTATRKKIIEYAKERGYDFSRIEEKNPAKSEILGTIAFILFRKHGAVVSDTPFFSQLSEGIDQGCKEFGYHLNIHYLYEGEDVAALLDTITRIGCKGIILLGTEMQPQDFAPFTGTTLPLVLLDACFDRLSVNCVMINNVQGACQAASYLINKCKTQPGYLRSSYAICNFDQRADGFYKAIREHGMATSKSQVHLLTPSTEGAYSDMLELLNQGEEPARCYFADNDLIACGAIRALTEKGYRIPGRCGRDGL